MHPFDETSNNSNTIIDQAFINAEALPPLPPPSASAPPQNMMTTMPMPMSMPMPMHNENQMVPNVMMDMPDEQFQQKKTPFDNDAQVGYMDPQQQTGYMNPQQQIGYMDPQPQVGYMDPQQQMGYTAGMPQQNGAYNLNVPPFDIEDPLMRRQFFRKVFTVLIIQHLLALPILEIIVLLCDDPISPKITKSFLLFNFLAFIAMYIFSEYRRYKPVNYIALLWTTLFVGIQAGFFATYVGPIIAGTYQLTVVLQLALMIAFSKQSRFRFTNITGILMALFSYLVVMTVIGIVAPHFPSILELWITFAIIYNVYDMQLQLSGHHSYNLKAEEYIFGACNIYADIPNFFWRFFRYIFLDHFVRIYHFFKKCCYAEVC